DDLPGGRVRRRARHGGVERARRAHVPLAEGRRVGAVHGGRGGRARVPQPAPGRGAELRLDRGGRRLTGVPAWGRPAWSCRRGAAGPRAAAPVTAAGARQVVTAGRLRAAWVMAC